MRHSSHGVEDKGLNLLIYPSALLSSGRLNKLAMSLQASGEFAATHIVGIGNKEATSETVAGKPPNITVTRVRGAKIRSRFGGIRIMLFWPLRVYSKYRNQRLASVAAQNVYLLPLAYHLSKRTGAIFVYNAHELETETIGSKGIKQKIARFLEQRYIMKTNVVSVVNESIADWYRERYPGIEPIVVTNTPIDIGGTVDLKDQLNIPDSDLLYIHVGFLMEGRSIPMLLEAFAERPRMHIAFLGDGYLRPIVETASTAHPNIHLLDVVPPDTVVSVVRGADIGVCLIQHVSLSDKLSTPNKLMEALSAGIPPLVSDLVEARRLLGDELCRTWLLEDPEAQLGEALDRITKADVATFKAMWNGVPSWDSQAVHLVEAYREAIKCATSQAGKA